MFSSLPSSKILWISYEAEDYLSLTITAPTHGLIVQTKLNNTYLASQWGLPTVSDHDAALSAPLVALFFSLLKLLLLWPSFCFSFTSQILFYWEHSSPILLTIFYINNSQPILNNSTQTSLLQGSLLWLCPTNHAAFCALIGLFVTVTALLGYHSHTIQFTHLEYRAQWFLIYSHNFATITTFNFKTSSLPQTETLCSLTVNLFPLNYSSPQFSSVRPTLCDTMNARPPCPSQTHVHWVSDAIQPSHPLSSPSPPALNLSQHQSLFKWVNSSHEVAKVLELQLQHQSSNEHPGLISFRMDWLDLLAVQGTLKSLLQHYSSKASILWCSAFFIVQLSHPYMTTRKTIALTRWTYVDKVMSLLLICCLGWS